MMYGLRLFIVALQEQHCLLLFTYLEVAITSPNFVALLLPVSQIAKCIA